MASVKKRTNAAGEVTYSIQAFVGRDADGRQLTKSMTWKPAAGMKPAAAEKEAQKQAVLFEEKVKAGVITIDGNMKFADYAARWLELASIKQTTLEAYEWKLKTCINPAIGHIPLEKLRPEHLQQLYKNLRENGIAPSKIKYQPPGLKQTLIEAGLPICKLAEHVGMSKNAMSLAANGGFVRYETMKKIENALREKGIETKGLFSVDKSNAKYGTDTICGVHITISAILHGAKKSRIIPYCVTEFVDPPKIEPKERRYLDEEQAREYLTTLMNFENVQIRTALILLLFTGMRRGELVGLEWRDIDFLDSRIYIRRGVVNTKKSGVSESTTKTSGSTRDIPVIPFVMETLQQYRKWQDEQAAAIGDLYSNETGKLFTLLDGKLLSPNRVREWAEYFSKKTGMPYMNPHAFRHTFISLQIAAGTDIKTLQSMSGHANTKTLMNVYAHTIESARQKAAAALGNTLLPPAHDIIQLSE